MDAEEDQCGSQSSRGTGGSMDTWLRTAYSTQFQPDQRDACCTCDRPVSHRTIRYGPCVRLPAGQKTPESAPAEGMQWHRVAWETGRHLCAPGGAECNWICCGRRVPCQEMGSSSFAEFRCHIAPQFFPLEGRCGDPGGNRYGRHASQATTIVAVACVREWCLPADRPRTAGKHVSKRDVDKGWFRCDEFSPAGVIAASWPWAVTLPRLCQIELEHTRAGGRSLVAGGS